MELSFSLQVELDEMRPIGVTPDGLRVNFLIKRGKVNGVHLKGKVLAEGGDWLTLRPDGILFLDVHLTVEVAPGVFVGLAYTGRGDAGPQAYQEFLAGKLPDRPVPLRATMRLEAPQHTGSPFMENLARLSKQMFVGIGEADLKTMTVLYNFYRIGPEYVAPGTDFTAGDLVSLRK